MQKTILKQQYENFAASRSEGLDKTYDRFQKLISQLEIIGEVISQEDANMKWLRSLPLAWNNIALIMRNKSDLDTLSMDDLYNNLKVYESEIKGQSSSSSNSQNVSFVYSENTSSTYEAVNTAHEVSTASSHSSTYVDDVIDGSQMAGGHAYHEGEKILKKTGRNLNFNGKETVVFDKTKVECYNCHMRGHFARECRALRNQGNRNRDAPRWVILVETPTNSLVIQDGIDQQREVLNKANIEIIAYQLGLESLEARIVVHKKNEAVYEEDIAFLKYDVKVRDNSITELKNQLAEALREKDDLKLNQMNENELHDCHLIKSEVFESSSDSSMNEIEEENNQTNVSETITSVPRNESTASKSSKDSLEEPKDVRPSAPIIEEWESDSDDDCDCNFYENKMVGKSMLNNMGRVTSQREVRLIWNNAQRVNQTKQIDSPPHSLKEYCSNSSCNNVWIVQFRLLRKAAPRAAASISTDSIRAFNQKSAAKTNNFNKKVYTAKVNNVTTAGPEVVVSTAEGKRENVVKSLACWIWRPTGKDQGIFDSRCSRHMTENKSYLTDYQDIDGGFIAFARSPKGGKITRKEKECFFSLRLTGLVLSPDFKLLDESQVLLKVPRQNNMYSFDLKNVVPSGGETLLEVCLQSFLKMTIHVLLVKKDANTKLLETLLVLGGAFFLATKDETSEILKTFITGIENQINHKVKIIKCDNGIEFKNNEMNQLCGMKGIKREFSVARTPQQNGVTERKNRTRIEAARTMLGIFTLT
ncbi:ribonuclease H-like domain-containing protein [Tanacetum coccineum]